MSLLPVVAVVGRPNVGKSTLVNRILGRRAAVVEEKPGVTRDRKEFVADWAGSEFVVVDTGGWEIDPQGDLTWGIREQAEVALRGADVVVFVTDARTAVTDDDVGVARVVQRAGVPYLFVANKADSPKTELELGHLWGLGLGEPLPISALHGRRTGEFLDRLLGVLPAREAGGGEDMVPTLAIIGRPNVGKSTLLNRLLGEPRVLVSQTPGTTRDAVDAIVELQGEPFRIFDTAGIRRAPKIKESTEWYSVRRAREALHRADVVLLMVDGTQGATHQEQRLTEEIATAGVGLVVLLNKWDAVDTEQKETTSESVADRLGFAAWAPVVRVSALTGARIHRIGGAVTLALQNRRRRIPTPTLNRLIRRWQEAHPPPVRKNKRARVIYAVQAGVDPPTIVLFVRGGRLGGDYLRFLENRLRDEFDFMGTPVHMLTRRRHRRPDDE
ncbi:MAG: ribosome biogenesis GTPase Der [Acidimicrobiia bacterium]